MPKNFGQCYMKNFEIAKNLIDEGMLVQNFKAISQESSPGNPLKFQSVTKYGGKGPREKSCFNLIFVAFYFYFLFFTLFFVFFLWFCLGFCFSFVYLFF